MVQFLPNPLAGIGEAGNILGQALAQKRAARGAQQGATLLQGLLSDLPPNPSAADLQNVLLQAVQQGVSPQQIQQVSQTFAPEIKERAKLQGSQDYMSAILQEGPTGAQIDLMSDEEIERMAPPSSGPTVDGLTQEQITKMIGSPYENIRRQGEALQKRIMKNEQQDKEQKFLYTKLNEPQIKDLNEKYDKAEENQLRYDRIEEIVDTASDKLPSSFSAAFFDLDGEGRLSKLARSQLSPEGQEFVKLVVDMLSGAKETFGARITNFDAKTYLKRLPGLLNTTEGKKRVLRDLSILNRLNQVNREGILNEFEAAGGTGAIPYSEAVRRARKANAQEIQSLKNEFVNPNKKTVKIIPDPVVNKGRTIRNNDTGEVLISDGQQWVIKAEE